MRCFYMLITFGRASPAPKYGLNQVVSLQARCKLSSWKQFVIFHLLQQHQEHKER